MNTQTKLTEEREVIGYNIKPEFSAVDIARAMNCNSEYSQRPNIWMFSHSAIVWKAKELKVLDIWFDKVYKAKPLIIQEMEVDITITENIRLLKDGRLAQVLTREDWKFIQSLTPQDIESINKLINK